MRNPDREVWEGWTVRNFIDEICGELDMIMVGGSFIEPCETKEELFKVVVELQPYYKKPIPEVNEYFTKRYNLK